MYILLESSHGNISDAHIWAIDCMGCTATEKEAIAWRNDNIDYRDYKFVPGLKKPEV